MIGVKPLDVHLPIVAVQSPMGLEAPKPTVYGTAFPILPGLFVTAGHVFKAVQADGTPALGKIAEDGALKVSEIVDTEGSTNRSRTDGLPRFGRHPADPSRIRLSTRIARSHSRCLD